jgi:hypothetical protein
VSKCKNKTQRLDKRKVIYEVIKLGKRVKEISDNEIKYLFKMSMFLYVTLAAETQPAE